jgi:TonB family protein
MSAASQHGGAFGRAINFAGQHRASVATAVLGLAGLAWLLNVMLHTARQPPVKQAPVITMVVVQPPKPPPPPPPLPQPKMITPQKVTIPEPKPMIPNQPPKAAPPKPAGPPAPSLGTAIHNSGAADNFDLSGNTGGNGMIGGGGGGGGGGSYEGAVAADIEAALARDPVTRNANAGLQVRIWVDANGVVTRVLLAKSSGDPAVDAAVDNRVLPGLQLPPPPAGTAMPMLMSLTGEQPLQ